MNPFLFWIAFWRRIFCPRVDMRFTHVSTITVVPLKAPSKKRDKSAQIIQFPTPIDDGCAARGWHRHMEGGE